MESKQGCFSLSTCLIDHEGRRRVLCKQVRYHLLGSTGIRQWHVIHVCVWVRPRRPKHLLWHRLGSEEWRSAVFFTSSATIFLETFQTALSAIPVARHSPLLWLFHPLHHCPVVVRWAAQPQILHLQSSRFRNLSFLLRIL